MSPTDRRKASQALLALGGATVIAATLGLFVVLLASISLAKSGYWLAVAGCCGGLALLASWWHERRAAREEELGARDRQDEVEHRAQQAEERAQRAEEQVQQAEEQVQRSKERAEQAEQQSQERERKLEQEQQERDRLRRRHVVERDWIRRLRDEIDRMHHERGVLGHTDDISELILRVAMSLVEADKGLLLSRQDADGDGALDLVTALGFEHEPGDSAVAQRFAGEVIESDTTLREDDAPDLPEADRTPADQEIENLVAIPIYVQDRFSGVVVCANREGGFEDLDDEVLLALGDHAGAILHNSRLRGDLRSAYVATVRVLAEAIEAKDHLVREHSDEVASYVASVAEELEVEPQVRELLIFGSLLHDVGKIGISERILLKPGPLTDEERRVVELHPRIGARIIEQVPALQPMTPAVLHHHERFDGDGYPSGLRGGEIPLEARIICVADSFSAMTADRPYREGMSLEQACEELERCAGTQFDPRVVEVFVAEVRRHAADATIPHALARALDDPELAVRRNGSAPVIGDRALMVSDNLTLLYSHSWFHDALEAEARRASVQDRPFAVVVVAITELDRINSEQGYAAGDEALRSLGGAVQRVATRWNGLGARISGRCVGLLVPGAGEEAARRLSSELSAELPDGLSVDCGDAAWRAGECGRDVVERARRALGEPSGEPVA